MLRILALNDDNHDTYFTMENGETFGYARDLIEFLAAPHDESYELKGFILIDYAGPAAELPEELVDQLFGFVAGHAKAPDGYDFEQAFNILWDSGSQWWH